MSMMGNKGEWSEIYVFLKLLADGRIYAADKHMRKIPSVFLDILEIIREEFSGKRYEYKLGKGCVHILLNGISCSPLFPTSEYKHNKDILWTKITTNSKGTFACPQVEQFLAKIHVQKLKSPPISKTGFFGGTEDIVMQVADYRSGVKSTVGFSIKSSAGSRSTLFNASAENTNFVYRVTGPVDDVVMNKFNSLFKFSKNRKEVSISGRMRFLKERGCDIAFEKMATKSAQGNIVLSAGVEMPGIVADMLKFYFFINEGKAEGSPIQCAIDYATKLNPAGYGYANNEALYRNKVGTMLYDMFTGMRLSREWDGRRCVNGGYVMVKPNGEVLAYHSCMSDEFKDFLISQLAFESPSCSRHRYMEIYKANGSYYIKLNLQIRFADLPSYAITPPASGLEKAAHKAMAKAQSYVTEDEFALVID